MNFNELTIYTTHLGSELVSDVLWQHTELGVVISDVEDVLALHKQGKTWDYIDNEVLERDKTVIVKAYFPIDDESLKNAKADLLKLTQFAELDLGSMEMIVREIDGDLWREKWKEHFKPIHIGKIVIVPEWIDYKLEKGEIPVYLDSNMAFGTGEHETTSMCIEYLQEVVRDSDVVLDVGSGSGILGIAASKLGAKKVIMTDIDECAVKSSNHNAKLNKIDNATVLFKNLLDDNTVKGNVIVANIMAEVLIYFSQKIGDNLLEKGKIILSGILNDRCSAVISAYESKGFKLISKKSKGEWSALLLEKGE